MDAALAFLAAHPYAVFLALCALAVPVWALIRKADRTGLDRLEQVGVIKAHPDAILWVEHVNAFIMDELQIMATAAGQVLQGAAALNEDTLRAMAAAAYKAALARARVAVPEGEAHAVASAGGQAQLDGQFLRQAVTSAKVLTTAPSGRALVKPA